MFIIYVLLLYIASIGCGSFIKKESKVYSLRSVIGFCTFLGVLQLFYYPLQYIKASSGAVNIITLILFLIAFIYGIFQLKKEDFKFLKSYEFWFLLLVVFIVIKIIPVNEAGDDSFYMSLFKDNSNIDSINTINPRTGLIGQIDSVYLYQGFYLLMSFLYRIQSLLFNGNIDNIFISYRATMSLFAVIMSSIIFIYIKENYKDKKNSKIFYLVQLLSFFLVAVLEWEHIYWGSFMIFQIFVPLIMILFDHYLTDKENYKYILLIINLGCLSLASSMLFLFAIIAFGYFVYEVFVTKKVKTYDYLLMLVPSFIYIGFLMNKIIIFLPLLIMIFLFKKFSKQIDEITIKYLKYLIIVLPVIFIMLSIIIHNKLNYPFSLELYRVSKITIVYNFVIVFYGIYLLVKKTKIDPNIFAFIIVVLYFFNPLVEPFVSHYLTSTHVYYRLFYITRNPFIVTIVFLNIYNTCKKHKLNKYASPLFIIGICLLIINYGRIFVTSTVLVDDYDISYNYILREDNYSRDLGKELSKLPDNSKIYSLYFAPRMYNDKLITKVVRYPNSKDEYWDSLTRIFYREEESEEKTYHYLEDYLIEEKINYIIIFNNDKLHKIDWFEGYYDIIFKNDRFVLIQIREDLWVS